MSISEIKALLSGDRVTENILKELMNDPRKGVQHLVASYIKHMNRESAERLRVEDMYEPESSFYKKGMTLVAGIDEVGRGPLAGPVTVAAVILKPHTFFAGINDSKKVSPKKREELAEEIHKKALAVSIVCVPAEEIDALNIYQATMEAMYRAVSCLKTAPEAVIVDAMPLHFGIPSLSLVHGDARSASVAAASIVAKVYRDHLMEEYDKEYPGYGFAQNKGYGTADHMEAIRRLGITPIHRKSFEPVKSMIMR